MTFVVRDIMTRYYPVARGDASVLDAASKIVELSLNAIPIVDAEGNLEGVLSQMDVLRLVVQSTDLAATPSNSVVQSKLGLGPDQAIEHPYDAIINGLNVAPVIEGGKLVGVVTPTDVEAQRQLIDMLGDRLPDLVTEIDRCDDMFYATRGGYLQAGASALARIQGAMKATGAQQPRTILDLPSGYGRVLRFLKVAFPQAELTACDINRDGVDFCARAFGARAIYSEADFSTIRLGGPFDLIWVGSLFTHLERGRWCDLLSLLTNHLALGGLLVFTTIGRCDTSSLRGLGLWEDQIEKIADDYEREGFGYQTYKGQADWGLTICSTEFLETQLAQYSDIRLVSHRPQAWLNQDVVACTKRSKE